MARHDKPYQSLATGQPRRSIWASFPWLGVASLILGIAAAISALGVGMFSDGLPLNAWTLVGGRPIQPSVALAITYTIGNILLSFAFTEGVAVAWWNSAQRGSSILGLQTTYDHAYRRLSLFTRWKEFSKVSVASIAILILWADGPLLQRASNVHLVSTTEQANLTIPAVYAPWEATGVNMVSDDSENPDIGLAEPRLYTPAFGQVLQQYNSRANVTIPHSGCRGSCSFDIVAPGWDLQCVDGSQPFFVLTGEQLGNAEISYQDMTTNKSYTPNQYASDYLNYVNATAFNTIVKLNFGNDMMYSSQPGQGTTITPAKKRDSSTGAFSPDVTSLVISTLYKSTSGCNATLSWQNCTLREALVKYRLQLENDTIALKQPMLHEGNNTVRLLARDQDSVGEQVYSSALGGFWLALQTQFATSTELIQIGPSVRLNNFNANANTYMDPSISSWYNLTSPNCTIRWMNPMDDVLSMANELALRAAIALPPEDRTAVPSYSDGIALVERAVEPDGSATQIVAATMTRTETVYRTDKGWLGGGVAVMLATCVALIPLYWGWWRDGVRDGKRAGLNPVGIAAKFDAPLLRGHEAWQMKVKYGARSCIDTLRGSGDSGVPRRHGAKKSLADVTSEDGSSFDWQAENPARASYGFQRVVDRTSAEPLNWI